MYPALRPSIVLWRVSGPIHRTMTRFRGLSSALPNLCTSSKNLPIFVWPIRRCALANGARHLELCSGERSGLLRQTRSAGQRRNCWMPVGGKRLRRDPRSLRRRALTEGRSVSARALSDGSASTSPTAHRVASCRQLEIAAQDIGLSRIIHAWIERCMPR